MSGVGAYNNATKEKMSEYMTINGDITEIILRLCKGVIIPSPFFERVSIYLPPL